jgi:hypothetical protein
VGGVGAPNVEVVVAGNRFFAEGVFIVGKNSLGDEIDGGAVCGDAGDALDFGAGRRAGDLVE